MPVIAPAAGPTPEVIDLISDSEDDDEPVTGPNIRTPDSEGGRRPISPLRELPLPPDLGGMDDYFHFEGDLDLQNALLQPEQAANPQAPAPYDHDYDFGFFAAGNAVPQQRAGADQEERDFEFALAVDGGQVFTADDCLQRVLELFPDVSHEYVAEQHAAFGLEDDYQSLPGAAILDNIVEKLLSDSTYPKQDRPKSPGLKRKRAQSDEATDVQQWLKEDRDPVPGFLIGSIRSMLKSEYPQFPNAEINRLFAEKKHLFQTHVHLAYLTDTENAQRRGRPSTRFANADTIALNSGWPELTRELEAARLRVTMDRKARAEDAARKKAEQENLQKAIDAGETAECQACFDDLPMNRQIHCNGDTAHFTCFECAETYVKSEVGESRCRVMCTAGCGAGFHPHQLNLLSDKKLLQKLAQLEQEKAIRDAGLDDLEECPFCDYKAIVPPIEEDFEFRCANPECEKVSCRRCRATTHIPLSCEQHVKDNKINSRHKIEEAMTAALVRNCNGCKKQFIKEYGCNKMTCPSCGHLQCYICSKTLKDYNHFDQGPGVRRGGGAAPVTAKCPLYDNVEERHEREVKAAEEAARAEVVAADPDVSVEDLEIKVSDAVKNVTAQRIRQAEPGGFGGVGGAYGGLGAFQAAMIGIREPRLPEVGGADPLAALEERYPGMGWRLRRAQANVGGNARVAEMRERLRELREARDALLRDAEQVGRDRDVEQAGRDRRRARMAIAAGRRVMFDVPPPPALPPPVVAQPPAPAPAPNDPAAMREMFGFFNAAGPPNQNQNQDLLADFAARWNPAANQENMNMDPFEDLQNIFGVGAAGAQPQHNHVPPPPRAQPMYQMFPPPPRNHNPPILAGTNANPAANNPANNNNNPFNFPPVPGAFHIGLYQAPQRAAFNPVPPPPAPNNNNNIGVRQARQGFEQLELMRQDYDAQNGLNHVGNNVGWVGNGAVRQRPRPNPRMGR